MKKRVLAVALCFVLAGSVSVCKKKETQPPVPQAPGPIMQGPMPPEAQQPVPGPGIITMPMGKSQVVVPDFVKGKWSAVKIIVEDKIIKKTREYTVNLNSDFKIPNSNLKIHVGEFLPDFRKYGFILTSASNKPNNPAVGIRVLEGDKQIFPTPGKKWGWLFSELPAVHTIKHPRYNFMLKEGVAKKG
ncbi:MAG: hypothetical protein QMC83_02170 [Thermodesulfovibrionales bacterium]|nr:hypothetical protein [Thermodesulfovibrionales bacterium]